LAAYGSGDEARLRAFYRDHLSPEAFARHPLEDQVAMALRVRGDFGALTLVGVKEDGPSRLRVRLRGEKGGSVAFIFAVQPDPPHLLAGIGVEAMAGGGEEEEAPPAPPRTERETAGAIQAFVDSLARAQAFSGVVRVTYHGHTLVEHAWGLADRAGRIPNRADSKFNLGSINKIFTRTAIAQLAQQGKLSLDQTIERWMPELAHDAASRITIRELLDHRSGLGDFFGSAFDAADKAKLVTNADFLPLFKDQPLLFAPGTQQRYSNAGYIVLGLVVERVSGEEYHDYVRRHVLALAGMTGTDSYRKDARVPNLAIGYTSDRTGGDLRANTRGLPARGSAAGGGYSTAPDLERFIAALEGGKLLDAHWSAWMFGGPEPTARAAPGPALPIAVGGLGIAGGSPGVNAVVEADLHANFCAVVLCNLDPPAAERVGRALRGWLTAICD
jgi:CubicO group peptidase (beta-lactamase class C family)